MIQDHRISVLAPVGLSLIALVCTILIFLVPLRGTVNLVRSERRRGHVGTPWTDLGIFACVVFYASLTLWFAKTPADRGINNIAWCHLTAVLL
jgi:di/tricarboxylate transporter